MNDSFIVHLINQWLGGVRRGGRERALSRLNEAAFEGIEDGDVVLNREEDAKVRAELAFCSSMKPGLGDRAADVVQQAISPRCYWHTLCRVENVRLCKRECASEGGQWRESKTPQHRKGAQMK